MDFLAAFRELNFEVGISALSRWGRLKRESTVLGAGHVVRLLDMCTIINCGKFGLDLPATGRSICASSTIIKGSL